MALKTEVRLAQNKQVIVHGTVRRVAVTTVVGQVCVLVHERSLLLRMALCARGLDRILSQAFLCAAAVRVVAIRAKYLFLRNWMMVRERESNLDILVAPLAHLGRVPGSHLQIVARVDVMTV
jgi:hypothetical protein